MSESNKLLRGTVVLTIGRVTGYGLSFVRNLILARLLSKVDYGLAAVFGMAMTLLEVSGRMGFGMQIIQSKAGGDGNFQASAHALQFFGGLCSACLIAGLSVPMARLFGVPSTSWAFAALAVVPLCQGLGHLDVSRFQRQFEYLPIVLVEVVPQFLITVAAWPLAIWFKDYRVIVWLMIGKAVTGAVLTFILATRPYRWAWEREHWRGMLSFGWPLLLTGLVMFGSQQADQLLVGAVFSLNTLASYSLAFSLVSIPWFIFGSVADSLMLPLLARVQDDAEHLHRQYRVCAQTAAVAGVIFTLPLIVLGEQLTTLLYGTKYQGTGVFVALLGAAAALRFLRLAPTIAAMARADNINQLYSNLWRAANLPLALGVVALGGTPVQIAGCGLVAEVLAVLVSVRLLRRRQGVPLRESSSACIYAVTMVSIATAVAVLARTSWSVWLATAVAAGTLAIALGAAWSIFPDVARLASDTMRRGSSLTAGQPAPT